MNDGLNKGLNLNSQWKRISNLQAYAKVLIFLQQNNITDMEQLADIVTNIHQRRYDLANKSAGR